MHNNGFDNEKFVRIQSEEVKKRMSLFDSKLFLMS